MLLLIGILYYSDETQKFEKTLSHPQILPFHSFQIATNSNQAKTHTAALPLFRRMYHFPSKSRQFGRGNREGLGSYK